MSKRSRTEDQGSAELQRKAKALLRRGGSRALKGLMSKSIAVCSGKGGVGKTITAANLAILFARQGLRVALVDLDPLSDVATLLDLADTETPAVQESGSGALDDYRLAVFARLDLIFPNPKLERSSRGALLETLFNALVTPLEESYDLLVFDLPAGSDYDENLVFLPFMKLMLLVTNPEPTAHVAAGAYIRRASVQVPDAPIHLWHNRYDANGREGFNPRDVAGNYNRNVAEEHRLGPAELKRIVDLAFVPEDPALNLLRGNPGASENIHRFLIDTLKFCDEQRLRTLAGGLKLPRLARELVVLYLSAHGAVDDAAQSLEAFGSYLRVLAARTGGNGDKARDVFSPAERQALGSYLDKAQRDGLRRRLLLLIGALEQRLREMENARGPFSPGVSVRANKAVDRELSGLLIDLSAQAPASPELMRQGGLLVFYFSLYKLLQSATVTQLIGRLVPSRRSSRGAVVRDRKRQITSLVAGDPEYRQQYLKTVRTLYPVVVRQITNMVKVLGLSPLLFRNAKGEILRSAYLKLLTSFLHDTLYSGLSVVVGFPYRASGRAFEDGAKRVLTAMGLKIATAAQTRVGPTPVSARPAAASPGR